jgi:RimJ/RimL family protein N-acetyltransferase
MEIATLISLAFLVLVIITVAKTARIVPQRSAFVVERLGKYVKTLEAGFHLLIPFVDRIAYRHTLKENALDVPRQACVTRDNIQIVVDGVLYLQVVDPKQASYGIQDYSYAAMQLAQTTLRSVIGKIDLDHIRRGPFSTGDLGYLLDRRHEGQSIMRRAMEEVLSMAFTDFKLNRVQAAIMPENNRSAGLVQRLGFREIGLAERYLKLNGDWRDHLLFEMVSRKPEKTNTAKQDAEPVKAPQQSETAKPAETAEISVPEKTDQKAC